MPASKVSAVTFLSKDVFELVLERDGVTFQPGDCFAIANPRGVSRPYSASSGSKEPYLRFVIRRMPNGQVSQWLAARVPGDAVDVGLPFGWFRPGFYLDGGGDPNDPSVFVATGTGIAPFLSRAEFPRPAAACLPLWSPLPGRCRGVGLPPPAVSAGAVRLHGNRFPRITTGGLPTCSVTCRSDRARTIISAASMR